MLQFFESISDFLSSAWEMIVNFFSSLVTAVLVVSNASSLPPMLLAFVPGIIGSSIAITVSVGVIKLLVGWGNK